MSIICALCKLVYAMLQYGAAGLAGLFCVIIKHFKNILCTTLLSMEVALFGHNRRSALLVEQDA